MGCWESSDIVTDCGALYGFIMDDYPGCGICTDCACEHGYTSNEVETVKAKARVWREQNPHKYLVKFHTQNGKTGSFKVKAASLEHAQMIVQKSLYDCIDVQISNC